MLHTFREQAVLWRWFYALVDKVVLETRKLLIQAAGHFVMTVMDEPSLIAACQKHSFNVAVIGQYVAPRMKRHLAMTIKHNCPGVRILELHPLCRERDLEDADSWLPVPDPISQQLLERVNELAEQKGNPAKARAAASN